MANWDSYVGEDYHIPYDYSYGIVDYNRIDPSYTTYDDDNASIYDPQYVEFHPMSYYYPADTSSASIACSVSAMSETKHVVYDPNFYSIYESPSQFRISYSVHDYNVPEFEEYDPTPYGGGYDISATYGKPLPPSEATCYPRSSFDPTKVPSFSSVPLAYVEDHHQNDMGKNGFASEPPIETKPTLTIEEPTIETKPMEAIEEAKEEEEEDEEEEEEEEEKVKVRYVPSGYGLEAMDLCETIFGGYFPCLLRKQSRHEGDRLQGSCYETNDCDPWKKTSDYLFGDLNPYYNENYDGRGGLETFDGYQWR